ncbi:MAG: alginate export family protein [Bacteroidetes bacterium]|nr:alginate export family protein [Bacteroidota bacterium]
MNQSTFSVVLVVLAMFVNGMFIRAQDNFSIGTQYRARTEVRNGYKTLSADTANTAFFIGQRTRLLLDYKKDNIACFSSIQDSRTWGDEEQKKDIAGLQVNELWVELTLFDSVSLKLGRQELVYDDHRLLGNLDWANLTISHDALVLKYISKEKGLNWHLGGAFNQFGEPLFGTSYLLKNYKFLAFTWVKKELPDINSTLTFTAVMNGLTSTDTLNKSPKSSFTLGPIFKYDNNPIKAYIGAYYQTGLTDNNKSISAFMVNAYGEYHTSDFIAGAGIDLLSGNETSTPSNENHSFNTLYATNHKFYGYMDYFTAIPNDTKLHGLTDIYVRLGIIPTNNLTTTLDIHSFSLANEISLDQTTIAKNLGLEMDLVMEYKPTKTINLQFGYSMMFASHNMELLKGGNKDSYNGWAFLMLRVSPTFFTHKFL